MIKDVLAGVTPDVWLFPPMMDVFVGAAALFIAFGLWKSKGLAVWTGAIVFFCLSISDHFDAMTVALTTKGPLPTMMSGAPSATATQLIVMSLIEIAVTWALASKNLRNHYLTTEPAK